MNKLYIIPKDIGNIEDVSLRVKKTIEECDFIVCEDTRVVGAFVKKLGIEKKEYISFTEHNQTKKTPIIINKINQGEVCGLLSDSGMPLVSDPGFYLVREAIKENIRIVPLPGPSAFITALVASGLPTDSFTFYGFLPKKKGKKEKKLKEALSRSETSIFYESPYRIDETLKNISDIDPERNIVIARELTKTFEEFIRGTAENVLKKEWVRKGEIVLLIEGNKDDK
ncbi:MAG: 16S rRNA (cytidine(1402)-2'-O)-methyltransferase [candidate division WOR-3 bacterium]|jgi:16S rRNA (cytidine1402-2'-O)-methyltransferase